MDGTLNVYDHIETSLSVLWLKSNACFHSTFAVLIYLEMNRSTKFSTVTLLFTRCQKEKTYLLVEDRYLSLLRTRNQCKNMLGNSIWWSSLFLKIRLSMSTDGSYGSILCHVWTLWIIAIHQRQQGLHWWTNGKCDVLSWSSSAIQVI